MAEPLLALSGVHTHIGHYHILQGVDFAVPRGELTMLLGRNGAGKTTTLRTILGLWRASAGEIRFDAADITRRQRKHVKLWQTLLGNEPPAGWEQMGFDELQVRLGELSAPEGP